jgi:peroxidase
MWTITVRIVGITLAEFPESIGVGGLGGEGCIVIHKLAKVGHQVGELGRTKLYNLLPQRKGYFHGYNDKIYPQVINEFATAAFRYGHTQVAQSSHTASKNYKLSDPVPITQYLFNNEYYRSSMDDIVRGALVDYSYAAGQPQVNDYFQDWLFNGAFYKDSKRWSLPTLNIQRGRDHGLPGYNLYREKCGLNRAYRFEEFDNIPSNVVEKWKSLYASPDDVDLFVGFFSEFPLERALVGPTAGC